MKKHDQISNIALRSILYEAILCPKPGLVDPITSGAHNDMDIFTFIDSAVCLREYFDKVYEISINYESEELSELFSVIREIGKEAEKKMLLETKGVNTHKGIIFSLGILVSAVGYLTKSKDKEEIDYNTLLTILPKVVKKMLRGLSKKDFSTIEHNYSNSAGEHQFIAYDIRGARGEAEDGFPTIFNLALPYLMNHQGELREKLLDTLMFISANIKDSNLIKRSGSIDILQEISDIHQKYEKSDNKIKFLTELDQEFINRNLSMGGSADLLILTIFLYLLKY